jgi:hypothetical protein
MALNILQNAKLLKNCSSCEHCVVKHVNQRCKLFTWSDKSKYIKTEIIRFQDFDLCGSEGKFFEKIKNDKYVCIVIPKNKE